MDLWFDPLRRDVAIRPSQITSLLLDFWHRFRNAAICISRDIGERLEIRREITGEKWEGGKKEGVWLNSCGVIENLQLELLLFSLPSLFGFNVICADWLEFDKTWKESSICFWGPLLFFPEKWICVSFWGFCRKRKIVNANRFFHFFRLWECKPIFFVASCF